MILVILVSFSASVSQPSQNITIYDIRYHDLPEYKYPIKYQWNSLGIKEFQWMSESNKQTSTIPKIQLMFIVEPSSPLILWKDNTYDTFNGKEWSQSNISYQYQTNFSNSDISNLTRIFNYTVYKMIPKPGFYRLIRPSISQSIILPNYSGKIREDTYKDYYIEANKKMIISYNTSYVYINFAQIINNKNNLTYHDLPENVKKINLKLYDNFPESIKNLSEKLKINNATPIEQAMYDTMYIKQNYVYSLEWANESDLKSNVDILDYVYKHKKGFCIHYSTMLVMILRSQGVPARLATGYAGGLPIMNKSYILSSYAHAWVEVYDPRIGWVPFDPTPYKVEDKETISPCGDRKRNFKMDWSSIGMTTPELRLILHRKTLDDISAISTERKNKNQGKQNKLNNSMFEHLEQLDPMELANMSDFSSFFNLSEINTTNTTMNQPYESLFNQSSNESLFNWSASMYEDYNESEENYSYEIHNFTPSTPPEEKIQKDLQTEEKTYEFAALLLLGASLILGIGIIYLIIKNVIDIVSTHSQEKNIEKQIRKAEYIFKKINLDKLIYEVEELGKKKRYKEAVIHAYRGLESYIAFITRLFNYPYLTAREYGSLVSKLKYYKDVKIIIKSFEDTRYTKNRNYQKEYKKVIQALKHLRDIRYQKKE